MTLSLLAWASINVNSYPMVVEMCKGSDIGKFTGYYYTFSMAAQVFTPIISGFFLEHVGYWTLFPYATIFNEERSLTSVSFCWLSELYPIMRMWLSYHPQFRFVQVRICLDDGRMPTLMGSGCPKFVLPCY